MNCFSMLPEISLRWDSFMTKTKKLQHWKENDR